MTKPPPDTMSLSFLSVGYIHCAIILPPKAQRSARHSRPTPSGSAGRERAWHIAGPPRPQNTHTMRNGCPNWRHIVLRRRSRALTLVFSCAREGRAILEGEVSSLKRRLRGMVGALSPDHATGVAARQDMDHFYDSQQGETGRGGSKETAGKASRNVGGGYPGGPQRDQSVRGVTGAKRGSSSRGLLVGWWKPDVDGSGRAFWYNRALGETSWSNPNESKKPSSGGEGLSKG